MNIGCVVIGVLLLVSCVHSYLVCAIAQIDIESSGFLNGCFIFSIILFLILCNFTTGKVKNRYLDSIIFWVDILVCSFIGFFVGGLLLFFGTSEKDPLDKGLNLLFQSVYLLIWTSPIIICLIMIVVNIYKNHTAKKSYKIRKKVITTYNAYINLYVKLKQITKEINQYKPLYKIADLFDYCYSLSIATEFDKIMRDNYYKTYTDILSKNNNLILPDDKTDIFDFLRKIEAKCLLMQNKKVVDVINKMPDEKIIDLWKCIGKKPQNIIEELIK